MKIRLAREYFDKVQNGLKTTTVRAGRREVTAGNAKFVSSDAEIDIVITSFEYKRLGELSDDDAIRDGFLNTLQLRDALKKYYPELDEKDDVTVIHFKLKNEMSRGAHDQKHKQRLGYG